MKNKYLLDTNIIKYFFNGITNDDRLLRMFLDSFNISIITKIEFLSWTKLAMDAYLYSKVKEFMENATVYDLDTKVADQTIINRQLFKIKTPDAIIAATAMVYNFELVTNNTDDFKKLDLKTTTVVLKDL